MKVSGLSTKKLNQSYLDRSQAMMEAPQTSSQASILIPSNYRQKESSDMKSSVSSHSEPSSKDDPLCDDDILSCISALDEVIAEFDDCSSFPYIAESDSHPYPYVVKSREEICVTVEDSGGAAASSTSPGTKENSTTTIQIGSSPTMLNSSQRLHSYSQKSFIPSLTSSSNNNPPKKRNNQQFNLKGSKSQDMPKRKGENCQQIHQIHKTSHLIHVSGSSPSSPSSSTSSTSSSGPGVSRLGIKSQRKSIPVASHNVNEGASTSAGAAKTSMEQETFSDADVHIASATQSSTSTKCASDTYSKATSFSALLVNGKQSGSANSKSIIHNNPFVSSSRNNNNSCNSPANSNGKDFHSQIMSSSNATTKIMGNGTNNGAALGANTGNSKISTKNNNNQTNKNHTHKNPNDVSTNYTEEKEVLQRAGGGVALTISSSAVPKVKARGQHTTTTTTTPTAEIKSVRPNHVQNPMRAIPNSGQSHSPKEIDDGFFNLRKEQWNFPSEKNLPRSLRKTRKTCLLDEDDENGPPSPNNNPGSQHQPPWVHTNGKSTTDTEEEISNAPISKRSNFMATNNANNNENIKIKTKKDDKWNTYEEIAVNQPTQTKTNGIGVTHVKQMQNTPTPTVLHIEDEYTTNEKTTVSSQPQPMSSRKKESIMSININHKNNEDDFDISESMPQVTIGPSSKSFNGANIPIEPMSHIKPLTSMNTNNTTNNGATDDVTHRNSQSVIIINKSLNNSYGNMSGASGSTGSCGSGRSSGRSSVISDNNNSMSTVNVAVNCCGSNSSRSNSISGVNNNNNVITTPLVENGNMNKSIINMNGNGSNSKNSSNNIIGGLGMNKGRSQLLSNGNNVLGIGATGTSSSSSSSVGGSGSGSSCAVVVDVDDGYLSMINRNETQMLWPDEMIENETFTADELKKISVHEICEGDEFLEGTGKSLNKLNQGMHGIQIGQDTNTKTNAMTRVMDEKTDYFSDDSLELEPDSAFTESGASISSHGGMFSGSMSMSMSGGDSRGMVYSAIPYKYKSGDRGEEQESQQHYYYEPAGYELQQQQKKTPRSHYVSRIPKMCNGNKGHHHHPVEHTDELGHGVQSEEQQKMNISFVSSSGGIIGDVSGCGRVVGGGVVETCVAPALNLSLRKPCSFFIPLSDELSSSSSSCSASGAVSSLSSSSGTGTGLAEVKSKSPPPRLMRQLTHEIKVETPHIDIASERQVVDLSGSAVHKDNAAATTTTTTCIPSNPSTPTATKTQQTSMGDSIRDRDRRDDIRQPSNNSTFLSSTSSPDLSSSDIQPSTESQSRGDESAERTLVNSDLYDSRFSLTSINDFVEEIMETALKSGFASINTNSQPSTNDKDKCTSTTSPSSSPKSGNATFSSKSQDTCNKQEAPNHLQDSLLEHGRNTTKTQGQDAQALFTTCSSTTPCGTTKSNTRGIDDVVSGETEHRGDYSGSGGGSGCESPSQIGCSESCQVRLQVDEIDELAEPEVDHDHQDKDQCRKNQIETVAKLQAAVTTFFTTNENFFSETKRFPAGTPTPADQSEETIDRSPPSPISCSDRDSDLIAQSPAFTDAPLMNSTRISLVLDFMSSPTDVEPENEAFIQQNSESVRSEEQEHKSGGDRSGSKISTGETEPYSFIEDLNEQPPAFIPTPPPELDISNSDMTQKSETSEENSNGSIASDKIKEVDLPQNSTENNLALPQLFNGNLGYNNKNIWPGYDRHFGGELLNAKPGNGKSLSSRSQENLLDAVTKERLEKAFATRGQASTLPLNCRPPTSQRRASTFRNMFNKFRKNKQPEQTIPEVPELKDEEVQSIASRDSRKKPGFFSRLFRRSRKH